MWLAGKSSRVLNVARVVAFVVGVIVGAVLFGAGLAILGSAVVPLDSSWLVPILILGVAALLLCETVGRSLPVPQIAWQVPKYWLLSRWRGYFAFGTVMGVGLFTRQPSSLYYLFPVGCLISGSGTIGAVFGAIYGLTYGGIFLYGMVAWRDDEPGSMGDRAILLHRYARIVGAVAAPTLVVIGF